MVVSVHDAHIFWCKCNQHSNDCRQDYKELSLSLSELPLNDYTVSELVRLCLRHHDTDNADADSDTDSGDVDADDEVVSDSLVISLYFILIQMLLNSKSG